jgi:hypothetical protein
LYEKYNLAFDMPNGWINRKGKLESWASETSRELNPIGHFVSESDAYAWKKKYNKEEDLEVTNTPIKCKITSTTDPVLHIKIPPKV